MTAHSYASRVCYSQGIADVVQASDGLKAARLLGARLHHCLAALTIAVMLFIAASPAAFSQTPAIAA
ncbi:MAG: hypothetical protein PVI41_03045, partial [Roseobacter sp.]